MFVRTCILLLLLLLLVLLLKVKEASLKLIHHSMGSQCSCLRSSVDFVAAWCSGNTLVSIYVVALRWARLVLGWVTVC